MRIKEVSYISDYTLLVVFDNGKKKTADFKKFVTKSLQPMTNQFMDKERFKKAYVDHGDLTWEDGQMDISAHSIYKGNYSPKKKSIKITKKKETSNI